MSINRSGIVLLTPSEMAEADRLTVSQGVSGFALMESAGRAVVEEILRRHADLRRVAILAGPGNNGGDAFVVARLLSEREIDVRLHLLGERGRLTGDAAKAADLYRGTIEGLADFDPRSADVVIDGLFGAGLSRAVEGETREAVEKANASGRPIVAIDLPSGVSGLSGAALGTAIRAETTVTFFCRKPGHLLEPGRTFCGEVVTAEIGIERSVLVDIRPRLFANEPSLWRPHFVGPSHAGHKFDRGHAVIFSGGATKTGAARMSATAALRIGAGLVTLYSPSSALLVNAAHLTAVMLQRCEDEAELVAHLADDRLNAFAIGPGFGIGEKARAFVHAILDADRHLVIDADAISSFKEEPDTLFAAIKAGRSSVVLTPHAGEFKRLFPGLSELGSKLDQACRAAERSGATIVLKGSDTVVAAPDGRASINGTGSPYLATAGSGDVLAGMIVGLLAQKLPAFEAASAAVWMHGMAGLSFGPGLIAEDLPGQIPGVLRLIREEQR